MGASSTTSPVSKPRARARSTVAYCSRDRTRLRSRSVLVGVVTRIRRRRMASPSIWAGPPMCGHGDVDRPGAAREQLPQPSGALMAQHRARPTCLHRRGPLAFAAQGRVPNRVDAMMEAMKAAGLCAPVAAGVRETASEQLVRGEDAMIALGQLSNPRLRAVNGRWLSHSESKSPFGPNFVPLRPAIRRPRCAVE